VYFFTPDKITDNGKKQERYKYTVCFVVKEKTEQQQVKGAGFVNLVKKRVSQQNRRQKAPEEQPSKKQRLLRIKKKYVFYPVYFTVDLELFR
jgi:hypothetical protein